MKIVRVTSKGFQFLVERDGKEVGRARLYLIVNDLHDEPYGLMEDVWVNPEYRGRHIGSELVRAVIAHARTQQCYKLIANSEHSRLKVHRFYENLGFTKHGIELRMDF